MLYTGFLLGLISSIHCIGMCGPIAMMLPVDHKNPAKKVLQIGSYHLGRLCAYALLGLLFGLLGKGLFLAGIQQQLSIIIGVLMIVFAITPERVLSQYNFSKPIYRLLSKIKTVLGNQFKKRSFKALFTIGLLNGFLPCGMVYVGLFGAIAMQNAAMGIGYMFWYGLGTIPMMSAVVYLTNWFSVPVRNRLQKMIPFVTVAIAMLFIIRGLGLNIPFVSPGDQNLVVQGNSICKMP